MYPAKIMAYNSPDTSPSFVIIHFENEVQGFRPNAAFDNEKRTAILIKV